MEDAEEEERACVSLPVDSRALIVLEGEVSEYKHTLKRGEIPRKKIKAGMKKCTTSLECQPTLSRIKIEDLVCEDPVLSDKWVREEMSSTATNRSIWNRPVPHPMFE